MISDNVDGRGSVFDPNPVVSERDEKLTDHDDANSDELFPAHKNVILRNLDGTGKLNGPYVNIAKAQRRSRAEPRPTRSSTSGTNDQFEQVMAYYQVNQTQEYIHCSASPR